MARQAHVQGLANAWKLSIDKSPVLLETREIQTSCATQFDADDVLYEPCRCTEGLYSAAQLHKAMLGLCQLRHSDNALRTAILNTLAAYTVPCKRINMGALTYVL